MSAKSRTSKVQRQHKIGELLSAEAVSSQDELVELLAEAGIAATQATVSRDLDDLGAVKVRVGGGGERVRNSRPPPRSDCAD